MVDARPLDSPQREQGVGYYLRQLLQALATADQDNSYFIVSETASAELQGLAAMFRDADLLRGSDLAAASVSGAIAGIGSSWRAARHCAADVAFFPAMNVVGFVGRTPSVICVHDLIQLLEKERWLRTGLRFRSACWLTRRASVVVCPSSSTRDDLVRLLRIAPDKIRVTHEAADDRYLAATATRASPAALAEYQIAVPYFLYVGDLRSPLHNDRKNLPLLIHAAARARETAETGFALVFAGKCGEHSEHLLGIARDLEIETQVRFLGYVPDEDLAALMAGARAFVYPSRYEGFGLPPLQAMSAGAPVVALHTSSIPEVVGDAGVLLSPPGSAEELAAVLLRLLHDDRWREDLIERGFRQASKFSWERCARETLDAFQFAVRA